MDYELCMYSYVSLITHMRLLQSSATNSELLVLTVPSLYFTLRCSFMKPCYVGLFDDFVSHLERGIAEGCIPITSSTIPRFPNPSAK